MRSSGSGLECRSENERAVDLGFSEGDHSVEMASDPIHRSLSRKLPIFILCGLFVFYLGMFQRYRAYDIDNPWFLSFSYDTYVEHINTDQFMNVRFPDGMDGTAIFGKLAAFVQYALLSHIGWQQWPMAVIASSFVMLSLTMWWMQLRRLGHSESFLLTFVIIVGLSEPFLSTANKFRYEYFSFALLSFGLLLAAYRKPLVGILVAALAVEVQPAALIGVIPVIVLSCHINRLTIGLFIRIASGLSIAGILYLCLHKSVLYHGYPLQHSSFPNSFWKGGFFASYFFDRRRHLTELLVFLIAGIFYWRRRNNINSHYLGISAIVMSIFSLFIPHGNASYMIFLYPFLVAMALSVVRLERRVATVIVALACAYVLPQYAALAYMNRSQGYRSQDVRQVTNMIKDAARQLDIKDDDLRIYGDYGLWFAHPRFYRAAAQTTISNVKDADLYLCFDHPVWGNPVIPEAMFYCPDIRRLVSLQLVSTAMIRGNMLYIYAKKNANLD
jgi:hypothetical protein